MSSSLHIIELQLIARSKMNWTGKKILITGAAGFIGTHLARRIVQLGGEPKLFIRYSSLPTELLLPEDLHELEIIRGDIRDFSAIDMAVEDCEYVFHLAALVGIPYSYTCPAEVLSVNVMGSANVIDAARRHSVARIIQTSTSEVYGSAQTIPITEDHPLNAQSPYAASKIASDQYALACARSFNQAVAILRPFNTYGPRQSTRAVIPTIIRQALLGKEINLGNVSSSRDFNFVSDTVNAFIKSAETDSALGCVTQFGSGVEITIKELVKKIAGILDIEFAIESVAERKRPADSEVDRLCADTEPARVKLGYESQVSLDEGLKKTIDWIKTDPTILSNGYEV
jgi:nucleoside-diphosphate-sugar epimerase